MADLDRSINSAVKSGKTALGLKTAIKEAKMRRAKAIVVASNTLQSYKEDLLHYAKLSNIPILEYPGTSQDLGTICGRPHLVSALTIYDPGDSDILELTT